MKKIEYILMITTAILANGAYIVFSIPHDFAGERRNLGGSFLRRGVEKFRVEGSRPPGRREVSLQGGE